MFIVMMLLVGGLYAAAFYLLQSRSATRLIFGLLLLGHAANLLIFSAGGLVRANPAIVPRDRQTPWPGYADPIPQALILTAIVISFAVLAFAAVLVKRAHTATGREEVGETRTADHEPC